MPQPRQEDAQRRSSAGVVGGCSGGRSSGRSAHISGQTFTGVNEAVVGNRPGIVKKTSMLEYGVYETKKVQLRLKYAGFDETRECHHPLTLAITLPEGWLDNPTPVSKLKSAFQKAYRLKYPEAPLANAADSEWSLAIKDASMFNWSKKRVPDDAIITKIFYERQQVCAKLQPDWHAMSTELLQLQNCYS